MKENTLFISLLFALLSFCKASQAQQFTNDLNGSPLPETKYPGVNGTPYLYDNWTTGIIELENGKTYKADIKYDIIADELMFKNTKGDSLILTQPVKQFQLDAPSIVFSKRLFRSGFPPPNNKLTNNTFYEVLFDGKVKLLKKSYKTIYSENVAYGSAAQSKTISLLTDYYLFKSGNTVSIKNDKKSLLKTLNDKSLELEKFIKDNHLDLKKDEDLIKALDYYNSL